MAGSGDREEEGGGLMRREGKRWEEGRKEEIKKIEQTKKKKERLTKKSEKYTKRKDKKTKQTFVLQKQVESSFKRY